MKKNLYNIYNRRRINEQFNFDDLTFTDDDKDSMYDVNIFTHNVQTPADDYYKEMLQTGKVTEEGLNYLRDKVSLVKPKNKEELDMIIEIYSKYYDSRREPLNWLDVSEISNMFGLFKNRQYNGDISQWDVSHVRYMQFMFYKSQFNNDISQWDVSHVENMSYMFMYSKFTGDISRWNVSNVKDKIDVFSDSQVVSVRRPKFR